MQQKLKKYWENTTAFLSSTQNTPKVLLATLFFGLWAGIFLSLPLWIGSHDFPKTAIIPYAPEFIDYILFATLILFSVWSLFSSRKLPFIITAVVLAVYCLFDILRAQPWVYYYAVFFLMLSALVSKKDAPSSAILRIFQLLFASIYVWSGVQKLNATFLVTIGPWFLRPLVQYFPGYTDLFGLIGMLSPGIEILAGVLLIFKKTQKPASWVLLGTHAVILLSLGPFGSNTNSVVWPWNIVMATYLFILFRKPVSTLKVFANWRCLVVVALFWIAPLGSFFNAWPLYFSGALYSGDVPSARILTSTNDNTYRTVSLTDWSYQNVNVPVIPSIWYFKKVFNTVCSQSSAPNTLLLEIQDRPKPTSLEQLILRFQCQDIK